MFGLDISSNRITMAVLFILSLKSFNLLDRPLLVGLSIFVGLQLDIGIAFLIAKALAPHIHLNF